MYQSRFLKIGPDSFSTIPDHGWLPLHPRRYGVGKPISGAADALIMKFASARCMANGSELNLRVHRSPANVWERRGWNGGREIAISRWLIGVGGGVLAVEGLRRRSLIGTLLAGVGGGLAWWALKGQRDLPDPKRWFGEVLERTGWAREDEIHESSAESFPASDAPSWTPTVGTGLRNRRVTPRPEPRAIQ